MEFFRKVKAMCATEFMTYATCLERGSSNMEFSHCRNTQVTITMMHNGELNIMSPTGKALKTNNHNDGIALCM